VLNLLPKNSAVVIADTFKCNSLARGLMMAELVRQGCLRPVLLGRNPLMRDLNLYKRRYRRYRFQLRLPVVLARVSSMLSACPTYGPLNPSTMRMTAAFRERQRKQPGAYDKMTSFNVLCPSTPEVCHHTTEDGKLIYSTDNWHLSYAGSLSIGELFAGNTSAVQALTDTTRQATRTNNNNNVTASSR
jgi:hypothetical protein